MIRYVVTMVAKSGLRVLAVGNQGRNHHDTQEAAQHWWDEVRKHSAPNTLASVFGDVDKVKVIPADCYEHGDCKCTVFGVDESAPAELKRICGLIQP